jgi:hypothetical protein
MIPAVCVVPDKHKNENWPRSFAAKPEPGEYVESRDGTRAIVLHVTHMENNINKPHIQVTLGI